MVVSVSVSSKTHENRFNSVGFLLVDCKILTMQLRSSEPYLWAMRELSGYEREHRLPYYRVVPCGNRGLFRKLDCDCRTGSDCIVENIEPALLDERDRCALCFMHLRRPLTDYCVPLSREERSWPEDILASYALDLKPGYRCESAWQVPEQEVRDHLFTGLRHVLATFLLQACKASGGHCSVERWQDQRWNYTHTEAQPSVLRHLDLGHHNW